MKKSAIIRIMRVFRKWWLLGRLYRECRTHSVGLSVQSLQFNAKHSVAREAFLETITEDIKNEDKRKKKLIWYNSIFDECIREGLILIEPVGKFLVEGSVLNPEGRPFFRTTDLGDKFYSTYLWKFFLDNAYSKGILIAGLSLITSYLIKDMFETATPQLPPPTPTVNVYPNITSPDIYPVININAK